LVSIHETELNDNEVFTILKNLDNAVPNAIHRKCYKLQNILQDVIFPYMFSLIS